MTIRKYSSRSQQTTLSSAITSGDLSMTVGSGANLLSSVNFSPAGTFTVVIDPDTALEEIVDVTARSGNVLTISRAIDGSTAVAHSAGAVVRHMIIGRDLSEANTHIEGTLAVHAATTSALLASTISDETGSGSLVFATSPTLTSPTITTPTISTPNITGTAAAVNLTASGTVTAALFSGPLTGAVTGNVTGNLTGNVTGNLTGTVTGGASLALPLAGGTMTGALTLSGAPSSGLHATTKTYVDLQVSNLVNGATAAYDTLKELGDLLIADESTAAALATTVAAKANIASPTLTGIPAAPTAAVSTNTTQIATTAYVMAATVSPSNLTGPITSIGSATTVTAQTGTGSTFVMNTSPTIVTPTLSGATVAGTINGTTIPSSVTLVKTADTLATLSATTSAQLAGVISDETGSGSLVFGTSPTIATPVISSPKISSTYSAKTAAYTFVSGDEGNIFSMNNAASVQFNIPTDATFNFAVGTEINVFWITGAGQPTIGAVTPGTTTVISTGATSATPKLRVANSGATCKKLAANSWIVFGDLS